MTAAILLSEAGHAVTLLERFERPQPLGAGLLIQPTGLRVLGRLGLYDDALKAGARVEGIDGRSDLGHSVLDLRYGDLDPRLHGLGLHRGALFTLLFERLKRAPATLITGFDVAAMDGTTVSAADGRKAGPFDLVLICDGAHSKRKPGADASRHGLRLGLLLGDLARSRTALRRPAAPALPRQSPHGRRAARGRGAGRRRQR
jgi:2-polyprenyl-6-methoxyphenol hydroxylase-like FAD-dependent oxidoreductase